MLSGSISASSVVDVQNNVEGTRFLIPVGIDAVQVSPQQLDELLLTLDVDALKFLYSLFDKLGNSRSSGNVCIVDLVALDRVS